MFTRLPGRLSPGVPPESIVAIIESINSPNVSVPDVGTEPAKGYLIGFATPAGGYGIICYLLLLETNFPVVYISNPPEVSFEEYMDLERTAVQYAESMGLMLDNMNFLALAPEARLRLVEQLPFFRDQQPRARDKGLSAPAATPGHGVSSQTSSQSQAWGGPSTGAGASTAELLLAARLLSSF